MAAVSPTPSQLSALESEHVIILGAGASGLAAAVLLARDHNVRVTVYERMDDLAQADEESYPIGVNPRVMKVLKMISPAMEDAIDVAAGKVAGWSIFDGKAGKQIALLKSGTVVGTTRGKVVSELYKAAADTAGVTMMLGHKLIKADTSSRTLTFAKASGEEVVVDYSASGTRVLDCTGCFSKLRTAVASTDPTFAVAATPWEISFRCLFTSDPPKATNLYPALHYIFTTAGIYAAVLTGSRWVFSLSVNPTMGLGDMKWLLEETATDENIARLKAHIATHLPQAVGMLEEEEYKAFFTRRSFTGQVTKLNRLNHSEEIAFLGDAAHAVIPSTGEGINAALEDVGVLLDARTANDGWFAQYNHARLDDANALSDWAGYLLEGMKADNAEKNRRTAGMVLSLIGQKMGVLAPTWNEKSFGRLSTRMERYSVIHTAWKKQMAKVQPWGNRLIYHFAVDGGKKQVRAAAKAAKAKGMRDPGATAKEGATTTVA